MIRKSFIYVVVVLCSELSQAYPQSYIHDLYELRVREVELSARRSVYSPLRLTRRAEKFSEVTRKQDPPKNEHEFGQLIASGPVRDKITTNDMQAYTEKVNDEMKQKWDAATTAQKGQDKYERKFPMSTLHVTGSGQEKQALIISQNRPSKEPSHGPIMQSILQQNTINEIGKAGKQDDLAGKQDAVLSKTEALQHAENDYRALSSEIRNPADSSQKQKLKEQHEQARDRLNAARAQSKAANNDLYQMKKKYSHSAGGKCSECLAMDEVTKAQGREALPGSVQVTAGETIDRTTKEKKYGLQQPCVSCMRIQKQEAVLDGNDPANADLCKRGAAACPYKPKQKVKQPVVTKKGKTKRSRVRRP